MNRETRLENKADFKRIILKLIPALYLACLFVGPYYITKLITAGREAILPVTVIDDIVPLWTPSVVIYFLAFAQWAAGAVIIMLQDDALRKRAFTAIFIALVLSSAIFIAFPTYTVRPEITGDGLFDKILAWVYLIDEPTNVLPSFHCLASWMIARLVMKCGGIPKWLKIGNLVLAILVFASVLLTKQHLFLDIPSALIIAEAALFISKKYVPDKLLDRLMFCDAGGETKEDTK